MLHKGFGVARMLSLPERTNSAHSLLCERPESGLTVCQAAPARLS